MNEEKATNILLVVFVMGSQADALMESLRQRNFRFTQVDSSGGFLQEKTICLFIGLSRDSLDEVLQIIRTNCRKRLQYIPARMDVAAALQGQPVMIEAEMGGALVVGVEVEQFIQLR